MFAALTAGFAGCSADQETTTADDELNESKALGMTDVTILYPLPGGLDNFDDMLGPSSEDAQGELLPASIFEELVKLDAPPMMAADGTVATTTTKLFAPFIDSFAYLRVVGIRLDPCFGESFDLGATDCTNTIRLAAQFFNPQASAVDGRATIHLFYKVSRADFTAIAQSMLALRKASGLPLMKGLFFEQNRGVHPTLKEEGLRGAYATALKALILKYAGVRTLARVAFAVEDRNVTPGGQYYGQNNTLGNNRWVFGGFEYRNALQPMSIASFDNYTGQQTVDTVGGARGRDPVVVTPSIVVPDNFLQTFNRKLEANNQLDPAKMEKARDSAVLLQNPTKYTTKNADCVSCHMAKQGAPNLSANPGAFRSATFRLDHTDDRVGPFRLFGYDGNSNPVISSRVVNETVIVLDYLNKNVLR